MKNLYRYVIALTMTTMGIVLTSCVVQDEPMEKVIERGLNRTTEQALLMAKKLEPEDGKLPKSIGKDGKLEMSGYGWWCSGFYPGTLWYLYENTPIPELKKYAELYTARVEPAKNVTNNHDVGFMLNCSFGNGYRLTQNPAYKDVMITGARSLATRYNEHIGVIRSWDFNKSKWQYPVIIDNMMNLEFLTVVSRMAEEKQFYQIAVNHANKTMEHHFRSDYSCYHVVSYDTITGLPHIKQTHQGWSDESSWSRGQAWALYGYTMMYRETGKKEYLELANNIADYLMNHPNMPEDKVPYWDFDMPEIPNTTRDASAAAIMASSLIDLSQMNSNEFGGKCLKMAEQQIRSLTSAAYLAEKGTNCNFALMHSTGHFRGNIEVDVPLTYADYYYVEALMRMKKLLNEK
ncbi:glycoside hydrolase family 88 protein [uncultured Parabacteroides sp.]|jgi:unsaturated chondroitin disaccharide hydrolase|uniref:glycoside hydrolase family 88 protein n=1 Tax=uncultured Parabacteroides sp. TaxID=512312 RepID=UPI0025D28DAD|nr:glycoside hydrolase family 88 protein [uncultured Parabacteroides sp.]